MRILRKYQLDIIFLFFSFLIFIWLFLLGLEYFDADPRQYEWYIAAPFLILYVVSLLKIRERINISDRRAPTGKTMIYWMALGITIIASYSSPLPAADFLTIDILFLAFTLFLADSYWDFKKITLKNILKKQT